MNLKELSKLLCVYFDHLSRIYFEVINLSRLRRTRENSLEKVGNVPFLCSQYKSVLTLFFSISINVFERITPNAYVYIPLNLSGKGTR